MKRILLLCIILFSASVSAQKTDSISHKHQMIVDINSGNFDRVIENISHVLDWTLDLRQENLLIDINSSLEFLKHIDSLQLQTQHIDSFTLYVARTSAFLGNYFYNEGNYNAALPYWDLTSTIYLSHLGENHLDYAASLCNLGNCYADIGDYTKAEEYYIEALRIYKTILGEEHSYHAGLLGNLGGMYIEIGDYAKAESYLLETLRIIKLTLGENHLSNAITLNNLGALYSSIGDYVKAELYYQEALNIRKANLGENHYDYAISLLRLGCLYRELEKYSKAETCLLEALRIYKSVFGENNPKYAEILIYLGDVYCRTNNNAKAESYLLEGLRIHKSIFGENDPKYATVLGNLGGLYRQLGEYSKAETYFLEALQICKSTLGESHPNYASLLHNLGNLYVKMRDLSNAELYHLEALRIRKAILGENHLDYVTSLGNIGSLYHELGEYSKAETYLLEALQTFKLIFGENHSRYAAFLHSLGSFYGEKNEHAKAIPYVFEALRIHKSIVGENNLNYAGTLSLLGDLHSDIGDYSMAKQCFTKSMPINKQLFVQSTMFMSENQRESFWRLMQWYFTRVYINFTYKFYTYDPSISTFAYDNELFVKGLLLNSSESVKRSILESNDTVLINQWNELTTKKHQIQVLQEKDPQSDYLKQIQEEAEQLEKQITQSSAAYRENQAMWQITWDSVRNHLSHNEVAIEYFSASLSKDSTMYCALFLRNDSEYPELIPLFEEKEITSFLSAESGNITNKTYDFYANGETISQLVWSKLLPKIEEGETIYFAPSGLLHQLAIEYLPYDENRTMSDVYNMVRLSSTREIVTNKSQADYTTATIYGGIQYDLDADNLLAESERYAKEDLLASRSIENDTLNRGNVQYLPGTKKEAETINTLLKENKITARLYTSSQANEESFKSLSGKHNNIIHIGTHGFTWTDSVAKKQDYFTQRIQLMGQEQQYDESIDPLNRCGLLFAGSNIALSGHSSELPDGVQDGILTAKEISLMDLRDADLVVLSACETAKGDITSEGVFGLQRAFKMAGVQTIIMSLWKVNDQATQLLMTEFYNNWIGKRQSKRDAFRNAQNTVRYSQYDDPVYWAGFIMLD